MMPNMDGYELIEGASQRGFTLPVLMVTAKKRLRTRKRILVGADDYMVKPVDMNEMLLRVSALLRRANVPTSTS